MELTVAFYVSYVLLWGFVIFGSLMLLGLVRTMADLRRVVEEPDTVGASAAPDFDAVDVHGALFHSSSLAGRARALVFVSTTCTACTNTLDVLAALKIKMTGTVVLVCRDTASECATLAGSYRIDGPVLLDSDHRLSQLYEVTSVPTAVIIDRNNRIQSVGHPSSPEDVERIAAATSDAA